jgi:demethylmenaquinone methyltransferase / 2-methoxy-6-polyprenyl-1,4-benzoquinol methylase
MKNKKYEKENPETIQSMFSDIAARYDKANAVLSFQMHKKWNTELVNQVSNSQNPKSLLDLCCGTGDIAFNYLKNAPQKKGLFLLDFCEEMLEIAREKAKEQKLDHHHITFIKADAQEIPLINESVSCCTMAYGIRNIKDPQKSIKEVFRVLRPGGTFGILELTKPKNPVLKFGHNIYLKTVLPIVGRWLTSNKDAYQYLCDSIHNFVAPEKIEEYLKQAGFEDTKILPQTGGIATIITGKKPKLETKVEAEKS